MRSVSCCCARFVCASSMGCWLILAMVASGPATAWGQSATDATAQPAELSKDALATATHKQTGLIQMNKVPGQPQAKLICFCLTADQRILAGCEGTTGEVRVFDADGKYLETWALPVKPEAIYARADGAIFLAGEGQVLKLSDQGKVLLNKEAPHAAAMGKDNDKVREAVIAQNKQTAEMYANQSKAYDQALETVDKQITSVKEQIAALDKTAAEGNEAEAARAQSRKVSLERQLAAQEQMKQQYEAAKVQWAEVSKQLPSAELTEAQIDAQVRASIASKLAASSISATSDHVFLATRGIVGYGYQVLKMDNQFENAEQIVSDLSGCCGQMDVKVNDDGVFVAENGKHRVCRYGLDGKLITNWGQGAREGLEGFGSCCNPMNVTFGRAGVVYTAEDGTGRIKRYSPEGKLLGLVGAVELVPGCKNVSIAVTSDESRVYMMDITRGHIVRMEPYPEGERPSPVPYEDRPEPAGRMIIDTSGESASTSSGGSILVDGLKALFGG